MEKTEKRKNMTECRREVYSYILVAIFVVLTGIGVSFVVKVNIGIGPWDALALTFSFLTGIKIGTVGMVFNLLCILGQFLIEKKEFKKVSFLQIPIAVLLGMIVNFFVYNVFVNLNFESYIVKIVVMIAAIAVISFFVSVILVLGKPTFPLESFCMSVHKGMNVHYSKFRQWVDIVVITVIIIVTVIFRLHWSLREGTVLFAIFFGPFLGIFMPRVEQFLEKTGIVDSKSEIEKIIEGEE